MFFFDFKQMKLKRNINGVTEWMTMTITKDRQTPPKKFYMTVSTCLPSLPLPPYPGGRSAGEAAAAGVADAVCVRGRSQAAGCAGRGWRRLAWSPAAAGACGRRRHAGRGPGCCLTPGLCPTAARSLSPSDLPALWTTPHTGQILGFKENFHHRILSNNCA